MSPILDAFFLLNIHELNVTADFNHRGPLVSFLAEIFPYPARYPTLRQVHLAIRKASGPRLEFMKDKLKSLSNLRHLTVECQRILLDVEAFKVLPTLPPLETLSFTRCYGTNEGNFLLMSVSYWVRRHSRQDAELERGTPETLLTPMTTRLCWMLAFTEARDYRRSGKTQASHQMVRLLGNLLSTRNPGR